MTREPVGAVRRVRRALGRWWLQLADSAVPRNPLNRGSANDYPRFPWF